MPTAPSILVTPWIRLSPMFRLTRKESSSTVTRAASPFSPGV